MEPPIASTPGNLPLDEPEDNDVCLVFGHGYTRRVLLVREHILAHYCGVFRPVRAITKEILLLHENAAAFEMILNYIYLKQWYRAPKTIPQGPMVSFDQMVDIYDIGLRFRMPLICNAIVNLFANRIKHTKSLPSKETIEYLWHTTPAGCTLRKLLVDLVREMWLPDGNKLCIWADLVGGNSENPDDLVWAIDELYRSTHTIRISEKTTVRLLACEWHDHLRNDHCEGSEEYKLLPEHYLWGQADRVSG